MQRRRCESCRRTKLVGDFPPRGRGRSRTCRACLEGVEPPPPVRPRVSRPATRLGRLGPNVGVTLVPSCSSCGEVGDRMLLAMPPELVESSRMAVMLVLAATHRGCGRLEVEVIRAVADC